MSNVIPSPTLFFTFPFFFLMSKHMSTWEQVLNRAIQPTNFRQEQLEPTFQLAGLHFSIPSQVRQRLYSCKLTTFIYFAAQRTQNCNIVLHLQSRQVNVHRIKTLHWRIFITLLEQAEYTNWQEPEYEALDTSHSAAASYSTAELVTASCLAILRESFHTLKLRTAYT